MRGIGVGLLFSGVLLTAMGYGGTFLLTDHFRTLGGSEIETGRALSGAIIGTFLGVPLVGWFKARFGGARLAALGALLVALGYLMLARLTSLSLLISVSGFLIGFGWGMFYLAGPLAVSERVTNADRGFWFLRVGAFQMAGIGAGPVLALVLRSALGLSTVAAFYLLAIECCAACICLWMFEAAAPRPAPDQSGVTGGFSNWVTSLGPLARTSAIYPILMVGLGACVFTGMMTFQSSLVRGSDLNAGVYFTIYALVVVASRFTLAPFINRADGNRMSILLLATMSAGVLAFFAIRLGAPIQALSAILLGLGYGLVYTVIQTQVVSDAAEVHQTGALTWFVVAYFVGIFGFPIVGGWLIVAFGTTVFLAVVLVCALAELGLALIRCQSLRAAPAQAASPMRDRA